MNSIEHTAPSAAQQLAAESLGTALLVATVVGSGIMAERLAAGNTAIALLANTIATGAGLVAFIVAFAPVSGAHFNPVVTLVAALHGSMRWGRAAAYVAVQIAGGIIGTIAANAMYGLPLVFASHHVRNSTGEWLGEFIATFGLVAVIIATSRRRPGITPIAVAAFITAAYWFTSSTSFANPAVTLARSLSDTFAGIRASDTIGFIAMQILGGAAAAFLIGRLVPVIASPNSKDTNE